MTLLDTGGQHRRSPSHEQQVDTEPSIALVRDDIFAVLAPRETMGFVERVGTVYVALHGPDLARAVEVGQTLAWDVAVDMVVRAYIKRD